MIRADGRKYDESRPVEITTGFIKFAEGSALIPCGDTVVLSSGMIGKIVRVEDREVGVEIATGVTVKVVKGMIAEVRAKGEPAVANDAKG